MPRIDGARVLADLKRLAEFGRYETGVDRPTYSAVDLASRHWLAGKFAEAGLEPVIDGIGNVFGRANEAARRLLVGSHSETQPKGGWLDGALGVVYALELARAFAADPALAGLGIETVAWADEEGHYGNMLGSRSFAGRLGDAEIDAAMSRDGVALRDALAAAGFAGRPRLEVEAGRHLGYLEAHIEQGDTLDSTGRRIGVVEGIVGIWNWRVVLTGQQNHAGTTQMARRKDAGVAMVRLAALIHDRFAGIAGPRTVWTIGRMLIEPNAPSVVPGRAEMLVQARDLDTAILARYRAALLELAAACDRAGPCRCEVEELSQTEPRLMDAVFENAIEAAAERHVPGLHVRLPSGAGHDAQVISHKLRAGMMFVPSLRGVSHHWSEDTKEDDIVLGAQVFADAAAAILKADEAMAIVLQESLRGLFYAPYYAAFALGAYEEEGVEVRFAAAPGFGNAPDGLFDGSTDAAWGGPMRVNQLYEQRADCDVVCFGEAVTRDPFLLVGSRPRADFAVADLARARLATVSEVPTPWLCLQHDLRLAGIDPAALDCVAGGTMAENMAALRAATVDVVQLFEPLAEELIAEGSGHLWYAAAASRGRCSYTTFYARRGVLAAKREEFQRLVRGLYRTQKWLHSQPAEALADTVQSYFAAVPRARLAAALGRYKALGVWGRDPILPRDGYERLKAGLVSGGFCKGVAYETAVDNALAEAAVKADPPPL